MDVAAEESLDLWMAADHRRQIPGVLWAPVSADIMPGDIERRVVDEKNRRPVGFSGESLVEPGEPLRTEHAFAFSRANRIECDQANWIVFDRVMKKFTVPGQIREVFKRGTQRADARDQLARPAAPQEVGKETDCGAPGRSTR